MFTYIKKDIIGYYFETADDISLIAGYENSVGTTWEDYLSGKFLLLTPEQIAFYETNPDASIEEVFNIKLNEPEIIPEPERTLEDAKQELHNQVDEFASSKRSFYVNGSPVWFSARADMKLQVDAEIAYGKETVTLYSDSGEAYTLSVSDASNAIISIEHYNTELQDFVQGLHNQIETIPSLEYADNININDFIQDAPSSPEFTLPESGNTYAIYYKYDNAYGDNSIDSLNEGDQYSVTIYPGEGYELEIASTSMMMGDESIPGQFDENLDNPGFARSAYFAIKSVTGNISVIGTGVAIGEPYSGEPETKGVYEVQYKITNCRIDNDIYSVAAGDSWKTSIYPEDGKALYIPDFTAEMGGKTLEVIFEPDVQERPNYASSVRIEVGSVSGDIFIVGVAY